jgi:uncharacterized membrane protein YfcA
VEDSLFFFLLLFVSGLFSGLLAGLFGVGGGIVIVPVCLFIFQKMGVSDSISMRMAVGTSLATIIPTSFMSARGHHRKKSVDISMLKKIGGWVVVGAVLGALTADYLSGNILQLIFGTMLFIMGVRLFSSSKKTKHVKNLDENPLNETSPLVFRSGGVFRSSGVFIGSLSAIMGIGGGSLSVPILSHFGFKIHKAIGTSAAIGMLIAVPATAGFIFFGWGEENILPLSFGYVNLMAVLAILPAVLIGSPLGVRLAHKIPASLLGKIFSGLLIAVSIKILWGLLSR